MASDERSEFLAKHVIETPDGFVFTQDPPYSDAMTFWLQFVFWLGSGAVALVIAIVLPLIETEIGSDPAGLILKLFISLLVASAGVSLRLVAWGMLTEPDAMTIEWNNLSKVIGYRCLLHAQEYEYVFKYEDWMGLLMVEGEYQDSLLMAIRIGAQVKISGPLKKGDLPNDWREFVLSAPAIDLHRVWVRLVHRREKPYVPFAIGPLNNPEHMIALIAKTGLSHQPPST